MGEAKHFTMRTDRWFDLALGLLQRRLGIHKAMVIRLAVAELLERHGLEVPAEDQEPDATA